MKITHPTTRDFMHNGSVYKGVKLKDNAGNEAWQVTSIAVTGEIRVFLVVGESFYKFTEFLSDGSRPKLTTLSECIATDLGPEQKREILDEISQWKS